MKEKQFTKSDLKELIKYKNAWEELMNPYKDLYKQCKTEEEFILLGMSGISALLEMAYELEQKHDIKDENDY